MAVKKQKLLQKADGYARDRKFKKAVSLYKQAIQEDSSDIRTRLRLSELQYQAGQMDDALEVLHFVGDYYREHGFLLKSVAVYKKMLEVDPARTELHGTLANLYFQLGMAPDAIRQFKAHVRALLKQGKMTDSLYVVRTMLELDPANVADRLRLAERFSQSELIDEAAAEYRRVLSLLEKNGNAADWGNVALRYLHHAPEDQSVRKKVVEFLLQQGHFHKALQHLHVCLEDEPEDAELFDMAGSCFEMLGQPEKAIVALRSLVGLYKQKGLVKEVHDAYVRILQLDPKDDQALGVLGIEETKGSEDSEVLELEWSMPDGYGDAPPLPPPTEFADTSYEAPSFGEAWASADEATVVEAVSDELFAELDLLDPIEDEVVAIAVDVLRVKRAIDAGAPLTPAELDQCGVELSSADREELEFFISSGLTEEALAILQEIYNRLA